MDQHEKYLLRVTAGPGYDTATHQVVPVNAPESVEIENEHVTLRLNVRVQNYRGEHYMHVMIFVSIKLY